MNKNPILSSYDRREGFIRTTCKGYNTSLNDQGNSFILSSIANASFNSVQLFGSGLIMSEIKETNPS